MCIEIVNPLRTALQQAMYKLIETGFTGNVEIHLLGGDVIFKIKDNESN